MQVPFSTMLVPMTTAFILTNRFSPGTTKGLASLKGISGTLYSYLVLKSARTSLSCARSASVRFAGGEGGGGTSAMTGVCLLAKPKPVKKETKLLSKEELLLLFCCILNAVK
jgi:hypothetical protein